MDAERAQLAAILEVGGISVSDEALFMLQEGVTPNNAETESRGDRLARATGVGAGLHGIAYVYRMLKDAEAQTAAGFQDHDHLDNIAKKASLVSKALLSAKGTKQWERLDESLRWRDLNLENIITELKVLGDEARELWSFNQDIYCRKGRPSEPETHLIENLHSLFSKLSGSNKIGVGGPAYQFVKAAAELIDPKIQLPHPEQLRGRLRQHRIRRAERESKLLRDME